ncbi:hypothetical protein GQ602_005163 [Ophiocordyceps camponoti-floridani]|uniref:Uncharacterized protein n=1 Tax=Ophiocordyceps camponoti-floridani TaxID=2030778 RepID=A0A8H4VD09_9HYPO|nr:hypothetical protein GQ602_005163 [Ophiocordyceps camponoti-floridani]
MMGFSRCVPRRPVVLVSVSLLFSFLVLRLLVTHDSSSWHRLGINRQSQQPGVKPYPQTNQSTLHILLPATHSDVNLCKTLLTLTMAGYPSPHIVAWGGKDDDGALRGGGSHNAKITSALAFVNDAERRRERGGFDDELVLMVDAYDVWFQLPVDVLLARYRSILADDEVRVRHRMGNSYEHGKIGHKVIFGAGKRCSPNQLHTLACYAVPESPLPADTHGVSTDSVLGRTFMSNGRQRFLVSGYMLGSVGAVRTVLERANRKLDECVGRTGVAFDNGSGDADFCYRGSDQSIFVEMFAEQEARREYLRRKHRSLLDPIMEVLIPNRPGSPPPKTHIMTEPISDMLSPSFPHQPFDASSVQDSEMAIVLDYFSLLGFQTSNAEFDGRFLRHDLPLGPQAGKTGLFDSTTWGSIPLFTDMCTGAIPVMLHHNSVDKTWREHAWPNAWWHGRARALLEGRRGRGRGLGRGVRG